MSNHITRESLGNLLSDVLSESNNISISSLDPTPSSTLTQQLSSDPPTLFNPNEGDDDDSFTNNATPFFSDAFFKVGRNQEVVQWQYDYHTEFVDWWSHTKWYNDHCGPTIQGIKWNALNRTSKVWELYFQGADRFTGAPLVVCKTCHNTLVHPGVKASGTSPMAAHLASSKCKQYSIATGVQGILTEKSFQQDKVKKLSHNTFVDQVLCAVISLKAPFRSVEDPEWKNLALLQNPLFPLPSANTIRDRLKIRTLDVESHMLENLPIDAKVSLSIDGWSSTTRLSFLGIQAHYVDKDWRLCEELIGFESLADVHSGTALATVVNKVTSTLQLQGRIMAITTDNASSNGSMLKELNAWLDEGLEKESFGSGIQHIPCLAHIIQLALQALLGQIRLRPTNETLLRNYEEDIALEELNAIADRETRGIPYVLAKLRKLCLLVNSSGQRRHKFDQVQQKLVDDAFHPFNKVLCLIMDVSTRWDSTCQMMVRAIRLRPAIDKFCETYRPAMHYALSRLEWKQISYLVDIVRPFNFFTSTVGKTKSITLPYALQIYDELFERIGESRRRLRLKAPNNPWVLDLVRGIDAAEIKLDKYYNLTYKDLGSYYGIGAILNPRMKTRSFDPDYCWLNFEIKDWQFEFQEHLRELFNKNYKDRKSSHQNLRIAREANMDPLAMMLDRTRSTRSEALLITDNEDSEVDEWINMGLDTRSPLLVWKGLQHQLPGLAAMARDLLAIPLAGVGVERVFNLARDICGYRRGHLLPATIRSIILVFHAQKRHNDAASIQQELSLTVDTSDMSPEAIASEIEARVEEINIRSDKANSWDKVEYISDEEDPIGAVFPDARSRRTQLRKDHHQTVRPFQTRYPVVTHTLSTAQRSVREAQARLNIQRDTNVDMRIYDIDDEPLRPRQALPTQRLTNAVAEREDSVNRAANGEELVLPEIRSGNTKRRAIDTIDRHIGKRRG